MLSRVRRRVVITGMGIACPLGYGVKHVWKKLLAGDSGIRKLPDREDFKSILCQVAGSVPLGTEEGEFNFDNFVSPAEARHLAEESIYSVGVTAQALADANWWPHKRSENDQLRTGVNIANVGYSVDLLVSNSELVKAGKLNKISPYLIPMVLPNLAAGYVGIRFKLQGPNLCVTTACAAGSHAIGDSASLISRGIADVMVAGGVELMLHPVILAGFSRAKALCTKFNNEPQKASRPFDSRRAGFVPSEGAAVLVLEELEHAQSRDASIYAEVLGYGMSGDAFHMTSPPEDGNGAQRAMVAAMRDAELQPEDVTHINAHATSTPVGDRIENYALKQVFKEHVENVLIYSAKGALGHTQGAAGAVESVIAALCIRDGVVPPNLNLESREPEFNLNYPTSSPVKWICTDGKRRIALNNSFGFGGTNSVLCIGEYIP